MNPARQVGRDEVLTTEQGLYIRDRAVEAARRTFIGRKLFGNSMRPIDSGAQTYGYDTLTHGSAATIDFNWPGRMSIDTVSKARTTVAIPTIHKEAEINKLDLASSRSSGMPLNTTQVESSSYKVAWLEDTILLNGYSADGTTYEINGLYQGAGNSESSSLDYGTAANIITSLNSAKALLLADNILPPYNAVLHPDQYAQLFPLIANTAVSYRQWYEQSLEGGQIFCSPAITAGTGIIVKADPTGLFEYVLAEDLTVQSYITSVKDGENLFNRIYLRGLPVIYDSNAICKLTTI